MIRALILSAALLAPAALADPVSLTWLRGRRSSKTAS